MKRHMRSPAAIAASSALILLSQASCSRSSSRVKDSHALTHVATAQTSQRAQALQRAYKWVSVVVVTDPFGASTSMPEVEALNAGAGALLKSDVQGSIAACREALDTPPSAKDYGLLGAVLPLTGSSNQFLAVESVSAAALSNLGIALQLAGDAHAAERALMQAIEVQPDFFPAHNNLGCLRRATEQWDAAVASFREALRIQPEYADARANLGVTLLLAGKSKEARSELKKAEKLLRSAQAAKRDDDVAAINALLQ